MCESSLPGEKDDIGSVGSGSERQSDHVVGRGGDSGRHHPPVLCLSQGGRGLGVAEGQD